MLTVGIHENLVVNKASKNDKGTLIVSIKQVNEANPFDILNGGGTSSSFEQAEQDFLFYPPSVMNQTNDSIDTHPNIMKKIGDVRDPLTAILSMYMTSDQIKWDVFAGTGCTAVDQIPVTVTNPAKLEKIYKNITDQFIKMITPHLGEKGKKLRMIFPRASKAKHFPAIRRRFLDTQPFVEPMSIPKEASKLRFSKYELDNGLDKGDPISGEQRVSKKEADAAAALLS